METAEPITPTKAMDERPFRAGGTAARLLRLSSAVQKENPPDTVRSDGTSSHAILRTTDTLNLTTLAACYGHDTIAPQPGARLGRALLLSILFHAMVVLLLIASLSYVPPDKSSTLGAPAPLQIAIVNVAPIAFVPPPEMPSPSAELPPALPRTEVPPPSPVIDPKAVQDKALPTPSPPPTPSVPMPPLGVFTQADAGSEVVSNDSPPPPGDIAVGAVQNPDRIGAIGSLRLAQRFPTTASRVPQLRDPLVVAYPPGPARAHLEARIAALLLVDADGKITETTLYPDEAQFGPSITEALKNARMTPATIDGKPVSYWTILEFVFTMRRPAVARQR